MAEQQKGPELSFVAGSVDLVDGKAYKLDSDNLLVVCDEFDDTEKIYISQGNWSAGETALVYEFTSGIRRVKAGGAVAVSNLLYISADGDFVAVNPTGSALPVAKSLEVGNSALSYITVVPLTLSIDPTVETMTVGAAALSQGEIAKWVAGVLVITDASDDSLDLYILQEDAAIGASTVVKVVRVSASVVAQSGKAFAADASLYISAAGLLTDTDPGSKKIRFTNGDVAATAAGELVKVYPKSIV